MTRFALLLALSACGSSAPAVGPSHKAAAPSYQASLDDALGFLPVDSEIVLAIDTKQIRSSQIWAALAPRVEQELGSELRDVRTQCGFDPLQTVDRVSIGLRTPDRSHVAGVVVVHGVGAGMMACLQPVFGKHTTVTRDHEIAIMGGNGEEQSAWTTIGSTLIVQFDLKTDRDSLRAVLASGSPLRTSREFMAMYDKLDHAASVWGLANGRSHAFDELDGEQIRPQLASGTLNVTDHLTLAMRATFADDAAAAKLDTMLKGAFGSIGKLVERAESRAEGRHVEVSVSIAGSQLQQVLGGF